jgi:hypothetical protein
VPISTALQEASMESQQDKDGKQQKSGTESVSPSETTQIEEQVENKILEQQPPPPPAPEVTPFPDK